MREQQVRGSLAQPGSRTRGRGRSPKAIYHELIVRACCRPRTGERPPCAHSPEKLSAPGGRQAGRRERWTLLMPPAGTEAARSTLSVNSQR